MRIDKYKTTDGHDKGTIWDGYTDPDGVWHQDANGFILGYIFGFCGCGMPTEAMKYIRDVMQHVENLHVLNNPDELTPDARSALYDKWAEDGKAIFPNQGAEYFAYYVLDAKGLTEHGGSVPGWLTPKGREVLSDINEILTMEENDHE